MNNSELKEVKITVADPSSLGLFGLAIITLVASSQKLGITTGLSYIIPWALFLGAFAQLFACIYDFKRNNVFGATAFGAYSFFWMATAMSWLIKLGAFGPSLSTGLDVKQLGFAYLGYLIFSVFMTIGAVETNKVLLSIFVLIDFLFVGLALTSFNILPELAHDIAGFSEILISLLSFYASGASVLNSHFGRVFLPVGKALGIFKK